MTPLTDALYAYMVAKGTREADVLRRLREESDKLPNGTWAVAPEQGAFLAFLVRAIGARRVFEVGTFTGYSALAVALALPDDGRIITCDINRAWTAIGEEFWAEAGVAHKIELRLGEGVDSLRELIEGDGRASFDFGFIDGDKVSYPTYLDQAWDLLRPGGIVVVDNVFWRGRVLDDSDDDPDTLGIVAFNDKIAADNRFDIVTLPVADGMTLGIRKP